MKTRFWLCAVVAVAGLMLLTAGMLNADDQGEGFKASCPISGGPAKETVSVDYLGKKVYFCCPGCPAKFEADTAKYAPVANHQLLVTGQIVQVGCPISGRAVNPDTAEELGNAKVAFCCENCQRKFNETEDKVALVLAKLDKGFTLQTACPLSGKKINPSVAVEHEGKKVYFCCPGCPAKFEAEPAKYTAKLPQFQKEQK